MNIGELLKETRKEKGLTRAQVAKDLLVQEKYIMALEEGNYDVIPGEVFQRAYFNKYVEYLGLKEYIDNLSSRSENDISDGNADEDGIFSGDWDTSRYVRVAVKIGLIILIPVLIIIAIQAPAEVTPVEEEQDMLTGTQVFEVVPTEEIHFDTPAPDVIDNDAASPVANDEHLIELSARGEVWVELRTRDETLFIGTMVSGDYLAFTDLFGFNLHAGAIEKLDVTFDGEPMDWNNSHDMIMPEGAFLFEEENPEPASEPDVTDSHEAGSDENTPDGNADPDSGNGESNPDQIHPD